MGDELLIASVRKYSAIYNKKSKEYRDATLRNAAWEDIAKVLGKTVEECKEHWNNLRNCYNNALKRREKKSGRSGKINTPWRFEQQMSFLKPYMDGRRLTSENLDASVSNENYSVPFAESAPYGESPTSPESFSSRTSSPTSRPPYKRKKGSDHYLADMMEIMKSSQEIRQNKHDMDELDTFFLSMSKMVKKLPRLDQIRIKMDLFNAVSEAELKQLESGQNPLGAPITIKYEYESDKQQ